MEDTILKIDNLSIHLVVIIPITEKFYLSCSQWNQSARFPRTILYLEYFY